MGSEQSRGADPGAVIDRMSIRLGEAAKQLVIAEIMIEGLEEENARLRADQKEE